MKSKQVWDDIVIDSKKRTKPRQIHKGLRTNPSIFQVLYINTTRSTNPSMSTILNNAFSRDVLEEITTRLVAASVAYKKQLINFKLWNFFHEKIGLCEKINAVF